MIEPLAWRARPSATPTIAIGKYVWGAKCEIANMTEVTAIVTAAELVLRSGW